MASQEPPTPKYRRRCFRFVFWSSDCVDQRGAFYVFRLAASWRKYIAFARPIPGFILGNAVAWLYVCACVIPIGWISAVSLFQRLQRRLSLRPFPGGAGLDPDLEGRRIPITSLAQNGLDSNLDLDCKTHIWYIYIYICVIYKYIYIYIYMCSIYIYIYIYIHIASQHTSPELVTLPSLGH